MYRPARRLHSGRYLTLGTIMIAPRVGIWLMPNSTSTRRGKHVSDVAVKLYELGRLSSPSPRYAKRTLDKWVSPFAHRICAWMALSAQHSQIGCGNCSSETLAADKKMMTHKELIAKMRSQPGYKEKYDEAAPEFELLRKMLKARKRAGLTSC